MTTRTSAPRSSAAGETKIVRRDPRDPRRNMERSQVIPVAVEIRDKEARARTMLATAQVMRCEAIALLAEAEMMKQGVGL